MKKIYYLIFLLIAFSACEKEEQVVEYEKQLNKNPPENNNLIINEQYHGNSSSQSSFWQIENSGKGTLYCLGKLNAADATYDVIVGDETSSEGHFDYIIGELTTSGELIKEKHPGFKLRHLLPFSQATGGFQNGLIAVGLVNNPTKARLIVYDNELSANSINFVNSEEGTWFNNITFKERNNDNYIFVAVGGKEIDEVYYPYICEIAINIENQTITVQSSITFSEKPNSYIVNIEFDPNQSNYFTSLSNQMNGDEVNISLLSLSVSYEVVWETLIQYQSYQTRQSIGALAFKNSKVFLACDTKDPDKGESSSGYMWKSGFISCVDYSGSAIWQTKIGVTNRDEQIYEIKVTNSFVFACGTHSNYISYKYEDNTDEFWSYGNGLISKLDISSGNIISNYTFGDADYESGVNDYVLINGQGFAVGWTKEYDEGSENVAWFLKLSDL